MVDLKTVLLIDDDIDLQQLTKIALKSKGYIVETANNGLEALDRLKTLTPALIILDMNMPKMGGLEFYQKICEGGGSHAKYPVLVLTARANMEQLFKDLDIDGFLAKPFDLDVLLVEVDTIIKKNSGLAKRIAVTEILPPHEVCIAENSEEIFNALGLAFLNAGYVVNPARTGTEAIERICAIVPDVAVINLGLTDIPGDIVILKLKKIAKTHNVRFVLYVDKTPEEITIAEKIGRKEVADRFVVFSGARQLVDTVNELLEG